MISVAGDFCSHVGTLSQAEPATMSRVGRRPLSFGLLSRMNNIAWINQFRFTWHFFKTENTLVSLEVLTPWSSLKCLPRMCADGKGFVFFYSAGEDIQKCSTSTVIFNLENEVKMALKRRCCIFRLFLLLIV